MKMIELLNNRKMQKKKQSQIFSFDSALKLYNVRIS